MLLALSEVRWRAALCCSVALLGIYAKAPAVHRCRDGTARMC
jgi:hypothetical protein